MLEIEIKKLLIDQLLHCKKHRDSILISEFPFMDKERRADLVLVGSTGLHAFEIKGDRDDLRKLGVQLSEYRKCFDSVTVVSSEKHISSISKLIPDGVGLALITQQQTLQMKRAKVRTRIHKKSVLNLLTRSQLELFMRVLGRSFKVRSKLELIDYLDKYSTLKEIKAFAHEAIRLKYSQKFDYFMQERGKVTLEEDVRTLTHHRDFELDK